MMTSQAKARIFRELSPKMVFFVITTTTNDDIVRDWRSSQEVFRLEDAQLLHFMNDTEHQ
jgi:hypothetical protein